MSRSHPAAGAPKPTGPLLAVRAASGSAGKLYQAAFARSGMTPLFIEQVPACGDPDFDSVWIYLGRKQ